MKRETKNTVLGFVFTILATVALVTLILAIYSLFTDKASDRISLYATYEDMVDAGVYEGTFAEWLEDYGFAGSTEVESSEETAAETVSSCLLSSVSITMTCTYQYTSSSGHGASMTSTATLGFAGSGIIYALDRENGDAYIVTNCHVIYDGAITEDGVTYTPTETPSYCAYLYGLESDAYAIEFSVVGYSLSNDVAVCKVEDSDVLKDSYAQAVTVGDSDSVAVGDECFLVGNSLGYGISASSGIVSVARETVSLTGADGETTVSLDAIRTDAAAYSGNSGGGMFSSAGEWIGTLFAGDTSNGGGNISECLPVNTVSAIADSILDYCDGDTKSTECFSLGIETALTAVEQVYLNGSNAVSTSDTLVVSSVESGSAAGSAGFRAQDVLVSVGDADGNTVSITHDWALSDFLWTVREGDTFEVTVQRSGRQQVLTVTADGACFETVS